MEFNDEIYPQGDQTQRDQNFRNAVAHGSGLNTNLNADAQFKPNRERPDEEEGEKVEKRVDPNALDVAAEAALEIRREYPYPL